MDTDAVIAVLQEQHKQTTETLYEIKTNIREVQQAQQGQDARLTRLEGHVSTISNVGKWGGGILSALLLTMLNKVFGFGQ